MRRPIVSELPPAAKGDTMRTGRAGQSCACAVAPSTMQAAAIQAGRRATGLMAPAASGNPATLFASPPRLGRSPGGPHYRLADRGGNRRASSGGSLANALGRILAPALRADERQVELCCRAGAAEQNALRVGAAGRAHQEELLFG